MRLKADVNCPGCKKKLELYVDEMVPGTSKACPHCKAKIDFKGDDGRKVQKGLDELEKAFKKLGGTFKIKL